MNNNTLENNVFSLEVSHPLNSDPYGLTPLAGLAPNAPLPSSAPLASPVPADIDLEIVGAAWIAQGAAPAINGQVENVNPSNEDQVIGAIHTVLADPNDADILWAGAVNGGVWQTTNATAANPKWTPLTDEFRGLSIGALEFDPTDIDPERDGPTIVAGIGHFSSYGTRGGPLTGLLVSTDGGDSFTPINPTLLQQRNISGVAMRSDTIVVSANNFGGGIDGGVYRSIDRGATWNFISGTNGLGTGAAFDLVGDPTNTQRLYVSVQGVGIFRSDDSGDSWVNISNNDTNLDGAITGIGNNNTEMAVANNGRVYSAVLTNGQPSYIGFADNPTSANPTWIEMDLPVTQESDGDFEGLNPREKPGGQGAIHFSIITDPNNSNIVYVGGDRQDFPFPNAIGANDFSGRLFRGDTTVAPSNPGSATNPNSPQWQPLTHSAGGFSGGGTSNNSAPHADSREMTFDANGNLIEVDDGGIYRRTNPGTANGDWFSIIGNLQVSEQHDIAYDPISDIIISGNQDTGTTQQQSTGSLKWDSVATADGGDVAVSVDPTNASQSVRYSSFQFLGDFRRQVYDNANNLIGNTAIELNGFDFSADGNGAVRGDEQFNTPVVVNAVDANRLVIGGAGRVYESFDQGDNVAVVNTPGGGTVGVNSFDGDPIAYGANDNADILYIGFGSTVRVRTTAGGTLANTGYIGGTVRDIVLDLDNSATAFALDSDQIFRTTNTGAAWSDITGDLSSLLDFSAAGGDFLRSIEYVSGSTQDAIVVGSTQGVFAALSDDWDDWFAVGPATLPNAPVWDMDADETDDVLVSGTLGRGAWLLSNIEDALNSAPTPDANGPYAVDEDGPIILDASSSTDPNGLALNYEWDLDNDGVFGETGANAEQGNEVGVNPTYSAAGLDGPIMETVALRVINSQGSSATTIAHINVLNVDPVITAFSSDATFADKAEEGEAVNITASFTDVGNLDTHSAVINWGDGSSDEVVTVNQGNGVGSIAGTHVYGNGGVFTITLTLTDDDRGSDVELTTAVVTGAGINNNILQIVGTNEDDNVFINLTGKGHLRVHTDFFNDGSFRNFNQSDVDQIRVYLCDGDDHATISSRVKAAAIISGGDGDDRLKGGGGPAVLLGNGGSDKLVSGKARSILIGGLGSDRLLGGRRADLLIGGSTLYDNPDPLTGNDQALSGILSEWNSSRSYDNRVNHIRNGNGPILGRTGFFLQSGITVFDDFISDWLTGSSGLDWFFIDPLDTANDKKPNEEVN